MNKILSNPQSWLALLIVGVIAYFYFRGPGQAATDISRTAVSTAGGILTGTVEGIGDNIGIPETSALKCQAAQAAGEFWNASLYCPASDFIKGLFKSGGTATSGDVPGAFVVNPSIFSGTGGYSS